jgi:GNAT superfamily N-acetyltransferase
VSEIVILPLTEERLPDLAEIFGERGDPSWCWCASFRLPSSEFGRNPEFNRGVLEQAVGTTAKEGRSPGLIAYREGSPVGWVSLGPRHDYRRLERSRLLAPVDDEQVWSVVCFVVIPSARGQGIAGALLEAGVEYARDHGATHLEGYPVEISGDRIPSPNAYMGTLSMFSRAGFEVVARRQATATSVVRPIVRLTF